VLTTGGLRVEALEDLLGVVFGSVTTVVRNEGAATAPADAMASWAAEQVSLWEASKLPPERKALCAEVALGYGASEGLLPLARWRDRWLNIHMLRAWVKKQNEVVMQFGEVSYEDEWDPIVKPLFEQDFKLRQDILYVPALANTWARSGVDSSQLASRIIAICQEVWTGCEIDQVDDYIIGYAGGEDIRRTVIVIGKPDSSDHSATR
jgi:hypothetical protein